MEMVILGSAGWVPQAERMTTCVAVRVGDALVLLDAGTGIARLREPRFARLLPREGSVDILLSHLHLDHTAGLTFLPALWQRSAARPSTSHRTRSAGYGPDVFERLVGPPFFPHGFADFPMPVVARCARPGPGGGRRPAARGARADAPRGVAGIPAGRPSRLPDRHAVRPRGGRVRGRRGRARARGMEQGPGRSRGPAARARRGTRRPRTRPGSRATPAPASCC